MLRLTLADNAIELYENIPVNLSYQFADLQNINSSRSSFSQTFRVPLTKKNQDYFGAVNELGLIPTWNPKTKVAAELSYNSVPIMRGFAQVNNIYIQKGKYADVELVVFGETANLSQDIGNSMLSDLDLSAYDHALTYPNVEDSWEGVHALPFDGSVRYGIVDKGQNWSGVAFAAELFDATPFVRAQIILDNIISEAGYTYDSTFFDSMTSLYLMANQGGRILTLDTFVENENFHVGLASNFVASGTATSVLSMVETGNFFDPGSNVVAGVYTAPYDGYYKFQFQFVLSVISASHTLHISFFKNGVEGQTIFDGQLADLAANVGIIAYYDPHLSQGDTVDIRYHFHNSSDTVTFLGNGDISLPTTSFHCYDIQAGEGSVKLSSNMPQMKQIDYISSLQKAFNLVFIPDRNNSKHLYIEPIGDYLATGTKKDWTNKIDLSKDIQVEPTTSLQAREYEWNLSPAKDIVNALVQKSSERVYGRYRVTDPENSFASGKKDIKTGFAPFVISLIPESSFVIHRMLVDTTEDDKSILNPLPKMAFWNGSIDSSNWSIGSILQTTFPMFSVYEHEPMAIEATDDMLLYGYERPFHQFAGNPLNTLYYKYWRPWVNELYSADARIITAFFRLTATEIAQFEFSDKIYLKDTYFRILEVKSFDPTTEGVVQVRMIKILDAIRDCRWLPYSFDKDGRVKFEDSDGTLDYQVTQECCERYGHIFEASTSFCYTQSPQQ